MSKITIRTEDKGVYVGDEFILGDDFVVLKKKGWLWTNTTHISAINIKDISEEPYKMDIVVKISVWIISIAALVIVFALVLVMLSQVFPETVADTSSVESPAQNCNKAVMLVREMANKKTLLRQGDTGKSVLIIKALLQKHQPVSGTAKFDADMTLAVKRFQTDFDLTSDGIIGMQTLTTLSRETIC